jgi:hypothetical protein
MRALRLTGLVLVITIITLGVLEGGLRLMAPRLGGQVGIIARTITTGSPYPESWTPAWQDSRDHRYTLRPGLQDVLQYGSASVSFQLTTHKLWDDGLPADEGIGFRTQPVDFGVDAVVVGDSFGFCFTEQRDCWVDHLAQDYSLGIVNLSTPVTGSLSHARMLADFGAPLTPPLVIWQFFGNDFNDDYGLLEWRGDIEAIPDSLSSLPEVEAPYLSSTFVTAALIEYLLTGRWSALPDNERDFTAQATVMVEGRPLSIGKPYELKALNMARPANQFGATQTMQALEEAKSRVEAWGGTLVVVMIPTREEVYARWVEPVLSTAGLNALRSAREEMNGLCLSIDLMCLDATEGLTQRAESGAWLYYSDDMHLNADGNFALSEILGGWLEGLNLITRKGDN